MWFSFLSVIFIHTKNIFLQFYNTELLLQLPVLLLCLVCFNRVPCHSQSIPSRFLFKYCESIRPSNTYNDSLGFTTGDVFIPMDIFTPLTLGYIPSRAAFQLRQTPSGYHVLEESIDNCHSPFQTDSWHLSGQQWPLLRQGICPFPGPCKSRRHLHSHDRAIAHCYCIHHNARPSTFGMVVLDDNEAPPESP